MATAILSIPTAEDRPFYTQRLRLDDRDYTFSFVWSQREERWYLGIYDEEDVLIKAGIKILANWPMLRWIKFDPRTPPGELMAFDLTIDGSPPGYDELGVGKRVDLTYFAVNEQ